MDSIWLQNARAIATKLEDTGTLRPFLCHDLFDRAGMPLAQ